MSSPQWAQDPLVVVSSQLVIHHPLTLTLPWRWAVLPYSHCYLQYDTIWPHDHLSVPQSRFGEVSGGEGMADPQRGWFNDRSTIAAAASPSLEPQTQGRTRGIGLTTEARGGVSAVL
jgi:hypothetical protein